MAERTRRRGTQSFFSETGSSSAAEPAGRGERKTSAAESAVAGRTGKSLHRHRRSQKSGQAVGPSDSRNPRHGEVIMTALDQLRPLVGVKQACHALSVPRATWYRRRKRRAGLFPAAPLLRKGSGIRCDHFPRANSPPCWHAFMRSVFRTARPRRSTRRCSMKAGFIARFAPCIGC